VICCALAGHWIGCTVGQSSFASVHLTDIIRAAGGLVKARGQTTRAVVRPALERTSVLPTHFLRNRSTANSYKQGHAASAHTKSSNTRQGVALQNGWRRKTATPHDNAPIELHSQAKRVKLFHRGSAIVFLRCENLGDHLQACNSSLPLGETGGACRRG